MYFLETHPPAFLGEYFAIWTHLGGAGKPLKHPKMTRGVKNKFQDFGRAVFFILDNTLVGILISLAHYYAEWYISAEISVKSH